MKRRNNFGDEEDERGKMFIGGLSADTTKDSIYRYFSQFGEVIDSVVMKNNDTGKSRGFGFVTFADPTVVEQVLASRPHQLDGRVVDPKSCNPRSMQKKKGNGTFPKVFLGGLPSAITESDISTHFERYGKVIEVIIMYDQQKKKSKGFGFISFEEEDAMERCVAERYVTLNGKRVEVKKAEFRGSRPNSGMQGDWNSGYGGGGMGGMSAPNGGGMGMPGNMMAGGYGGWNQGGASASYGYGTPATNNAFQGGWGMPPSNQQAPPQWGGNYGGPPQQQAAYGYYPPQQNNPQQGYDNNWGWQNGPADSSGQVAAGGYGQGDVYNGRPAVPGMMDMGIKSEPGYAGYGGAPVKSEYGAYPAAGYQQQQQPQPGGGWNYAGGDDGSQNGQYRYKDEMQ